MWDFLIGLVVGCIIGVFLVALISAAPDPDDGGEDDDED